MSHALVHLGLLLVDAVRFVGWLLVTGFVAAGSCMYGGYPAYSSWRGPGVPKPKHRDEIEIRAQVSAGIAEIEAYLAAQPPADDRSGPGPQTTERRDADLPEGRPRRDDRT